MFSDIPSSCFLAMFCRCSLIVFLTRMLRFCSFSRDFVATSYSVNSVLVHQMAICILRSEKTKKAAHSSDSPRGRRHLAHARSKVTPWRVVRSSLLRRKISHRSSTRTPQQHHTITAGHSEPLDQQWCQEHCSM